MVATFRPNKADYFQIHACGYGCVALFQWSCERVNESYILMLEYVHAPSNMRCNWKLLQAIAKKNAIRLLKVSAGIMTNYFSGF